MFLRIICRSVVLNLTHFPIEIAWWIKVMPPVQPAKAFNLWCVHTSAMQSLSPFICTGELLSALIWNVGSTFSSALPPYTSAPVLRVEHLSSCRRRWSFSWWLAGERLSHGPSRALDVELLERALTQVPVQNRDWNFVGGSLKRRCCRTESKPVWTKADSS